MVTKLAAVGIIGCSQLPSGIIFHPGLMGQFENIIKETSCTIEDDKSVIIFGE